MGQGPSLACEPCFCGVLAIQPSSMLPGSYPDSDGADKEESISAHKICKETDDNIFQQAVESKNQSAQERSPAQVQNACTVARSTAGPPSVAFTTQRSPSRSQSLNSVQLRKKSCIRRCIWAQAQQPDAVLYFPYWLYSYCCQVVLAVTLLAMFLALGIVLILQSGSLHEVVIPYTADLAEKEFTLDHDFEDDVLVYYDMVFWANHKSFVESRDRRVVYTSLSSMTCSHADSRDWARTRRGNDTTFMSRVEAADGDGLTPCGLVAMSLFTDNFTFYQSTADGWERLDANESDVSLPSDDLSFGKILPPLEGEDRMHTVVSDQRIETWLTPLFFEHWKVWYRTPIAPHVRNLWAVIKGGMPKGTYKVFFEENSQIWHDWGVAEKRLIFTTKHGLGNRGAISTTGGLCLAIAGLEVVALFLMLTIPRLCRTNRPVVQPERPTL
mmetsp:Transcript_42945/g.80131  ORF Transcript_42945/g.80131 Transcript_42945/m.80131 type:complete len:441 (-) Transcript_42945:253-1575(-)